MSMQYNGGCAVQRGMSSTPGDITSTVGDIMSTVGDIMSTVGVFSTLGGYHEDTRGYRGKCGGRSLRKHLNLYGNPSVLNILWCTHDIHHTHHGISQCTHCIPPLYS